MIIRIVRMTFREDAIVDFLALFEKNKKAIRAFPGCRHLELHRDAHNPAIFCTYSHWDNEERLNDYRNSELFGTVWPSTKKLFAAKPTAISNECIDRIDLEN